MPLVNLPDLRQENDTVKTLQAKRRCAVTGPSKARQGRQGKWLPARMGRSSSPPIPFALEICYWTRSPAQEDST